jgi:hypothetical protein
VEKYIRNTKLFSKIMFANVIYEDKVVRAAQEKVRYLSRKSYGADKYSLWTKLRVPNVKA